MKLSEYNQVLTKSFTKEQMNSVIGRMNLNFSVQDRRTLDLGLIDDYLFDALPKASLTEVQLDETLSSDMDVTNKQLLVLKKRFTFEAIRDALYKVVQDALGHYRYTFPGDSEPTGRINISAGKVLCIIKDNEDEKISYVGPKRLKLSLKTAYEERVLGA